MTNTLRMPQPHLRWGVAENGELIAAFPTKNKAEEYAADLDSSYVDIIELQPRFMRLDQARDKIGMSRSWMYSEMEHGDFPQPIQIGSSKSRTKVWLEHEVDEWIRQQIRAARGSQVLEEAK